jgi:WhiB family redox-sensing transcriptional regulator
VQNDNWRSYSLCDEATQHLFFSPNTEDIDRAKSICSSCPVKSQCLESALVGPPNAGIWGGYDEDERKRIKRRRAKRNHRNKEIAST